MGKLILGNGILGRELKIQTNWKIISRKDGFDITDPLTFIGEELDNSQTIINCAAFTETYSKLRDEHWNVNYRGVKNLIDYCNWSNKKLVHISTAYIYSGSVDNASEKDVPVHNNCWYTYTKLLADGLVQLESEDYLLIRCIHKEKPFNHSVAWINQIGNFDYVDVIAEIIVKLINKNCKGVYNVGTELKTMHDLAKDIDPGLCPDKIPKNISMNLNKLKCEF